MDQLSIILPVHNEEDSIARVISAWNTQLRHLRLKYHFIACEDGSTDRTKHILRGLRDKYPLLLDLHNSRRGYSTAIVAGLRLAKSAYILVVDSDGQYDPRDFASFWRSRNPSVILIGNRTPRRDLFIRKLYSRIFRLVFLLLFPTPLHDPSAGFLLIPRQLITPYLSHLTYLNEGFEWNLIAIAVKQHLPVREIPVRHYFRTKGQTQVFHLSRIPDIAARNFIGLVKLKLLKL